MKLKKAPENAQSASIPALDSRNEYIVVLWGYMNSPEGRSDSRDDLDFTSPGLEKVESSVASMRADALGAPESGKEATLRGPSERYRKVQQEIIDLQTRVAQTNEVAVTKPVGDPMREEFTSFARKDLAEITRLQGEKGILEQEIKDKGGNPSDYTVQ